LVVKPPNSSPEPRASRSDDYEKIKREAAQRRRAASLEGRDIGDIPKVKNDKRRRKSQKSLRYHLECYYPHLFCLKFSADHLKLIAALEETARTGGQKAFAFPRGFGKTCISEGAMEWAVLHGLISFGVLVGATEPHAEEMLDSIKADFETNEALLEDFPEVCFPIWALEGIVNRCGGQLCGGERTRIQWTGKRIVLPTVAGSKASGAIIDVAGITGRIRGKKFKLEDGSAARPQFVIIDDPQTAESANSLTQITSRLKTIFGDILGLAGHKKRIAAICPCTVIRPDDVADQLLKRSEWRGQRTKMLQAFPTNEKLWDEYRSLRADGMGAEADGALGPGEGTKACNAFYKANRAAMDEGALASWPEAFDGDELSAVQHAMNLLIRDRESFFAECQSEPLPDETQTQEQLSVDEVCRKVSGLPKGTVPIGCQVLTAFVDVHESCLMFTAVAWEATFAGYLLDYGAFPDQQRSYFVLRDAQKTLALRYPGAALEGRIYAGLEELVDELLGRVWRRDDGAELRIERLLIDANWGKSTPTVKKFCRATKHARVVMASHGTYVGARSKQFADYHKKPGDVTGLNWRVPKAQGKEVRHVLWDTNWWKTKVRDCLRAPLGDAGCLALWGPKEKAAQHTLFAEHCTAEFSVKTQGRGREVDEWDQRPGRDNHWWDCLVGSAVAASMEGLEPPTSTIPSKAKRGPSPFAEKKRLSLSEIQAQRRRAA
jgi:hypothetical protein